LNILFEWPFSLDDFMRWWSFFCVEINFQYQLRKQTTFRERRLDCITSIFFIQKRIQHGSQFLLHSKILDKKLYFYWGPLKLKITWKNPPCKYPQPNKQQEVEKVPMSVRNFTRINRTILPSIIPNELPSNKNINWSHDNKKFYFYCTLFVYYYVHMP